MRVFFPILLLSMFLLAGCEEEALIEIGTTGFITQIVDRDEVLIGDVIYRISDETQISNSSGKVLRKSDLQIGMKIQPYYIGNLSDTFPSRCDAKLLRVLKDEQSLDESKMMKSVIYDLRRNEDEHFIITNVIHKLAENVYEMDVMRRSNVDLGFSITVNEGTYEILYKKSKNGG